MSENQDISQKIDAFKKENPLPFSLKKEVAVFTEQLFQTLFDNQANTENSLKELALTFENLVSLACWNPQANCQSVWESYTEELPVILEALHLDAKAILAGDPASQSLEEIYLSYPGFYAIAIYRLAHPLYLRNFPLVPRLMTEVAHSKTGVDIHPGAQIGHSFCMDHATGIVIGETTQIGNHVKLYQGVTLGALSVRKELSKTKRHPTIEDQVTIYANATILGGDTLVGHHSTIGGNAWITSSVKAHSKVFHHSEIKIKSHGE
ncbi:MAG: serine acetyltransferase [Flavobacteriia bacterium]|nr:serine acetyltransferase [Flavobacteriia bacterium]